MKTIREIKRERKEQVREMYLRGMNIKEIAKELGCANSTISHYVKEMGIGKDYKKMEREILRLHREGVENKQVAEMVGCSRWWVAEVLRKHGLGKRRSLVVIEEDLINENTVYATDYSNRELETIIINGKKYIDITPIFSPK